MHALTDKQLGLRRSAAGCRYSEIISGPFWIYRCGGDHIKDTGKHLGTHLELCPGTEIPGPDTLLRGIKELPEPDIQYTSEPFTLFPEENNCRLVIQRQKRKDSEPDLFDGIHTYRCIATDDRERSDKDIVLFYNGRGACEKTFDAMNNDFGWSHLPCSQTHKPLCRITA